MNGLPCSKELADNPSDLFLFALEGEVSGIDEMHLGVRIIALKGFGAWRQEVRIILAHTARSGAVGCECARRRIASRWSTPVRCLSRLSWLASLVGIRCMVKMRA
jgi:hypothetical protein